MPVKSLQQLAYEKVLETNADWFNLEPFCNMYQPDWDNISENYPMTVEFVVKYLDKINIEKLQDNKNIPFSIGAFGPDRNKAEFYHKDNCYQFFGGSDSSDEDEDEEEEDAITWCQRAYLDFRVRSMDKNVIRKGLENQLASGWY